MKAEDTVMKLDDLKAIRDAVEAQDHTYTISIILAICEAIAEEQAEISYKAGQEQARLEFNPDYLDFKKGVEAGRKLGRKAGIKEVVEWIERYSTHHTRELLLTHEKDKIFLLVIRNQEWQSKLKEWGIE